jgi:hypothetical protein
MDELQMCSQGTCRLPRVCIEELFDLSWVGVSGSQVCVNRCEPPYRAGKILLAAIVCELGG